MAISMSMTEANINSATKASSSSLHLIPGLIPEKYIIVLIAMII